MLGAVLFLIVASAVKRYASTIPAPLEPVTPGVVAVVAAKLDLPPDLVYADIMTMMREQAPPKSTPPSPDATQSRLGASPGVLGAPERWTRDAWTPSSTRLTPTTSG